MHANQTRNQEEEKPIGRERRELEAKEERRDMGRLRGLGQAWGRRMAKVGRHQPPWGVKVPLLELPFGKLVDFQLCDKN